MCRAASRVGWRERAAIDEVSMGFGGKDVGSRGGERVRRCMYSEKKSGKVAEGFAAAILQRMGDMVESSEKCTVKRCKPWFWIRIQRD